MLALTVDLIIFDLQDGSFDTPDYVRTAVVTSKEALTGKPFGDYRDANLPTALGQSASGGPPDLTSWLVTTMKANAAGPVADILHQAIAGDWKNQTGAYLAWTALVKTDGPWDFKVELNAAKVGTVALGGQTFKFDVVANIHYGYVGIASGFSPEALLKGAGLAQIKAGTSQWSYWNSNFDDPYDQFAAWLGMWLYQQYGDKLTKEQLNAAINKYESCLSGGGGAPCSIPSNP